MQALSYHVKKVAKEALMYLLLTLGSFGMLLTVAQYFSFRNDIGFLQMKQGYLHILIWKIAFYVHVFSAVVALLAGFTQFSKDVLKKHRAVHRAAGKIYAADILLINFPAGMIMAVYANGGLPSKTAFVILDILWFFFTWKAVKSARSGKFRQHREFMIRSYALTCSAVTLRTWKIILSHTMHIEPGMLYMIDAWMGFIPNLLFAEWLIRRPGKQLSGVV